MEKQIYFARRRSLGKKMKKNQRGFSLIELLISFSLIMFLIIGAAQLTLYSLLIKRRCAYSIKSAELASAKLEYFKSLGYQSEELNEGSKTETLRARNPRGNYKRKWKIQDVSPFLKSMEMECFFENCPQKKVRLKLFLSRNIGF